MGDESKFHAGHCVGCQVAPGIANSTPLGLNCDESGRPNFCGKIVASLSLLSWTVKSSPTAAALERGVLGTSSDPFGPFDVTEHFLFSVRSLMD